MNGKEVFQLGKLGKCSTGFVQFLLKLHRLFQHLLLFSKESAGRFKSCPPQHAEKM